MKKICEYCGKEFESTGRNASRRKYCPEGHDITCSICGKVFHVSNFDSGIPTTCSKECSNKARSLHMAESVRRKYGVSNVSQHPSIHKKVVEHIKSSVPRANATRKQTCIARFGAPSPIQNPKIRSKIEQTNLKKFGVTNAASSSEIKQKISEALKSDKVRSDYIHTSQIKFGTDYPAQSEEVLAKMKSTCLSRYGKEWASQNTEISDKISKSVRSKFLNNPEIIAKQQNSLHETCLQRYGVDWPCQLPQCRLPGGAISAVNKQLADDIHQLGITVELETHLENYSFDLCLPELNILIEIDPTYTHNVLGNHWNKTGLDSKYHQMKSNLAKKYGYRCIHIFDWDSLTKILNLLKFKQSVGARSLKLKEVPLQDTNLFEDIYHLQGRCKGQEVRLGLYNESQLVQIMTFGKSRYNKNYQWELLRLCSLPEYAVIGGASKLFRCFQKNWKPTSIISYCDLSKFNGNVYIDIGMHLDHISPPSKIWSKGSSKITDNLLRQRGFDQLFNTNFGKGTSNEDLMLEHGWLPVYDCGQSIYSYTAN